MGEEERREEIERAVDGRERINGEMLPRKGIIKINKRVRRIFCLFHVNYVNHSLLMVMFEYMTMIGGITSNRSW